MSRQTLLVKEAVRQSGHEVVLRRLKMKRRKKQIEIKQSARDIIIPYWKVLWGKGKECIYETKDDPVFLLSIIEVSNLTPYVCDFYAFRQITLLLQAQYVHKKKYKQVQQDKRKELK